MRRLARSVPWVCLLATLTTAACDDTFTPITASDVSFSIFGILDAAADTQWVRATPLRPAALTAPGSLGARVTVENLATGRVMELHDSVFRFLGNPNVGSDGVFLHNFWTTEPIEPGGTYRFSATRDGRPPSEAVVQLPPDFEMAEVWLRQARTNGSDLVLVGGVEYLPFVGVANHFYDSCGPGIERLFTRLAPRDSSDHLVPIAGGFEGRKDQRCARVVIEKREVLVVASGAEWPSGLEYRSGRLGLTDPPSNISNSAGFLGGVLIKRLPYERCQIESVPPSSDYCRLRYDASSVTLRGTLTDTTCGEQSVPGATVQLRELGPPPGAPRRIRYTLSDHLGTYEIGALEAGKRYALSALGPKIGGVDAYGEHRDTLTFVPGELATRNIGLRRSISCSEKL
jgi:hypothetical protein